MIERKCDPDFKVKIFFKKVSEQNQRFQLDVHLFTY